MIYEARVATVIPGREDIFITRTSTEYFPMVKKHGGKPVGIFQTVFGNSEEVFYVLAWNDLTQRDKVLQTMRKDADYIEMSDRWTAAPSISNLSSRIVKQPTEPFMSSAAGAP